MLQLASATLIAHVVFTRRIAATRSRGSKCHQSGMGESSLSPMDLHISQVSWCSARDKDSQPIRETTYTVATSCDSAYQNGRRHRNPARLAAKIQGLW